MTDVLKVSGDDLRGFDSELTADSPLIITDVLSGLSWRRVLSSAATKIIGKSPLGLSTAYFGFLFRKVGNPASSQVMLHPFTSAGATAFRVRVSSTGALILDGAVTNTLDTSVVLANDTTYALVGQATAAAVTITIYAADGTTVVDTLTATNTFGVVDNWRMGQIGGSPALPDWLFRMLLVADAPITTAMLLATPAAVTTPTQAFIGDSNTAMMGANGSYVFTELQNRGVSTRNTGYVGVGGKRIAAPDLTGKTTVQNMDDLFEQLGTVGHWVFALGTNDRPQNDATVNAAIDTVLAKVDALTPSAKVTWIGLTSKGSASADDIRVNNLIKAKLAARPNAVFADWDAYIRAIDGGDVNSPLWLTTDTTHMSPTGYPHRATFYVNQVAAPTGVTGTVAQTLPALASQAAGATSAPAYTGTASATLPGLTQAATGATVPPAYAAAVASTLPALTAAASAVTDVPHTGAVVDAALPGLTSSAAGVTEPPAASGTISSSLPALTSAATGSVSAPAGGVVASVFAALTAAVVGVVTGRTAPPIPEHRTLEPIEIRHTLTGASERRTLEDA